MSGRGVRNRDARSIVVAYNETRCICSPDRDFCFMKTLRIASLPEHSITSEVSSQLQDLLEECFPGWLEGRTYYKQLPHFRLMAMDAERVVGQVGVDGRIINVGGE